MREEDELAFRLQVAAKILEKAADKTSDPQLRQQLRSLAARLREGKLSAVEHLKERERVRTLDDVVNEIREWIWSDFKIPKHEHVVTEEGYDPLSKLEATIDRIVEEFDNRMKLLDRLLEVLP